MKTSNLLRCAAILPLFAFFFTSCSKDAIPKPDPAKDAAQSSSRFVPNSLSDEPTDDNGFGTIQLMVTPFEAKASVTVFNDFFSYGERYPDENGIIYIPKIWEGTYSIRIHPYNPDFPNEVIINDITVTRDVVTDLGEIILQ
jgi:hypothetical protein